MKKFFKPGTLCRVKTWLQRLNLTRTPYLMDADNIVREELKDGDLVIYLDSFEGDYEMVFHEIIWKDTTGWVNADLEPVDTSE